jgi:hypothetical protein
MRRLFPILAAAAALAGCATAAPPVAPAPLPVAVVVAAPVIAPPPPPALTVASLLGADEATVTARLGEPAVARAEGQGALWTYRRPSCALFVFFRMDGGRRVVSGLDAGARRPGAGAPSADACLAAGAGQ